MDRVKDTLKSIVTGAITIFFIFGILTWFSSELPYSPVTKDNFNFVYTVTMLCISLLLFFRSAIFAYSKRIVICHPIFFSLALMSYALGEATWHIYTTYYEIQLPYPSLADIWYTLFYPFALGGIVLLIAQIQNANIRILRLTTFALVLISLFSYLFIVMFSDNLAGTVDVKTIFDVSYIIWDAILLAAVMILIGATIVSPLPNKLFFPTAFLSGLGILLMLIADTLFAYGTEVGTYIEGGKIDALYLITFYVLSLAALKMHLPFEKSPIRTAEH